MTQQSRFVHCFLIVGNLNLILHDNGSHIYYYQLLIRYDRYRGVIAVIAIVDGSIRSGDHITSNTTGKSYEVKEKKVANNVLNNF